MSLKHVCLSAFSSNASLSVVSNVDTLIGVKRNGLSLFNEHNFNRWDVSAWSKYHPSVNGISHGTICLSVSFLSSQQECFVFSKNVDCLDSSYYLFTRLNKEALRTNSKNLLSKLVLSLIIFRIENVAELVFSEDSDLLLLNVELVHV